MTRAVLSIGSNLGDRLAALQRAVDTMRPWLTGVSSLYETPPWGPVPQNDYLNAILLVDDVAAQPGDWLERAHAAEREAGRIRDVRWGPRTLDVDVVTVDDLVRADPALTLPHPRAAQRAFVLVPWLALDADAVLGGRRVADLIAALPEADVAGARAVEAALA